MNFLEKSDLEAVKHVALTYLYLDPVKFDDIELVIHHPFSTSSHMFLKDKDTQEYVDCDLFTDEGFRIFTDQYRELISVAKDVLGIWILITKPYKTQFFASILPYLAIQTAAHCFVDCYKSCDYINVDTTLNKGHLIHLFREFNKYNNTLIMTGPDLYLYYDLLDRLKSGETVRLYRGTNSVTSHPITDALSWTTSLEVAQEFATRYIYSYEDKTKHTAFLAKLDLTAQDIPFILACFDSESEVVIDTELLMYKDDKMLTYSEYK